MTTADIDEALIALFQYDPGADERLMGFGPDAFHRVMRLYSTHRPADFPPRLAELTAGMGREAVDHWSHAVAVVAWANPGLYIDQLTKLGTLEVVILGDLDDPRVVELLVRALDSDEWLVRYHAIRSLAKRPEPEARQHIRRGLTDEARITREEAEQALRESPDR